MKITNRVKSILIIIVVAILLIVVGSILFVGNKSNKEEKKEEEKKEEIKTYFESGIFTNGNIEIRLVVNDNDATIKYLDGDNASNYGFIKHENKFVNDIENPTITIKADKAKTIEIESTDEKVKSGIYNKTKEYNIEELLIDRFGDITYLTSDLSGEYKNNQKTLNILQTSESSITIKVDNNTFTMGFDKNENGVYVNSFSKIEVELVKEGDTLTLKSANELYNGTFKKEKSYTNEDVFDIFVDM